MKPNLQALVDDLLAKYAGVDPATWAMTEWAYAGAMLVAAGIVFVFALHFAGLFIFFERRIAARMQARVGPNRVGPNGLLQFVVDGLKCLFKEDLIPKDADQVLFRLSPYFVVLGMVLAFAALPFSSLLIATDINIGLLYILGVTSLVVIGLLMGGWGSNSKWALLGGMRSAAQVVSYEIPAGLAAMTMIIVAGSLSMQDLIKVQGEHPAGVALLQPLSWGLFHSPFVALSALIFFVAQLAEGNRTPFDLPEAESELVSGYNTEYSGMRFLMFFLGEFANVWILSALPVALYLGGWQIPWGTQADGITPSEWVVSAAPIIMAVVIIGGAIPAVLIGIQVLRYVRPAFAKIDTAQIPTAWLSASIGDSPTAGKGVRALLKLGMVGAGIGHIVAAFALIGAAVWQLSLADPSAMALRNVVAINALQLGIFVVKTLIIVFIVIQLRWTLPRIRVDQMMVLCWKYLVPLSFICVVGTLVWELVCAMGTIGAGLGVLMRAVMAAGTLFVCVRYARRVLFNYDVDKKSFENMRGEPLYVPPWQLGLKQPSPR